MSSANSETKTRILASALKLLKQKGGKGVRMSDIAAAANVSRQAVYLHFESRVQLMVATVQYGDQLNRASKQVQPWVEAQGLAKLDAWIEFWGAYMPQIYGVAKALMVARDSDDAAAAAWADRMNDVRNSCRKTIASLVEQGCLAEPWNAEQAADLLWTLLALPGWEQYVHECGWTTAQYVDRMKIAARRLLIKT